MVQKAQVLTQLDAQGIAYTTGRDYDTLLSGFEIEILAKDFNATCKSLKKGQGIVSLDLSGFDGAICSHFVVCHADSTTQVDAISQSIEDKVFEVMGEWPVRVEGRQNSFWVAMDYSDVIVHIFQTELRDFYRLEELWADAPMKRYEFGD